MNEQQDKVVVLEQFVGKIRDLHSSYATLLEKLATVQADASQAGLESIAKSLGRPFSDASEDARSIENLLHDAEMDRNKLKASAG